ncbi:MULTISPECIES: hypothetical protein [Embleya]|nr:hypothetical protein [Embleya scabrispora]
MNRLTQKATVEAGCSNTYFCGGGVLFLYQCCKDEGCTTTRVGNC